MRYYQIKYVLGEIVGRTFPQSQQVVSNIPISAPNHLFSSGRKLEHNVYIPDSKIESNAKVTDLISSSPIVLQLIISDKLKNLIQNSREDGLQFFPTKLIHKRKVVVNYWILNAFERDYHYINFEKSKILIKNNIQNTSKAVDLKTLDSFKMALMTIKYPEYLRIEKLYLIDGIKPDLLIIDRTIGMFFYFSEKLKIEIENAGCTGIEFLPI
jgi:hypothetical protein